MAGLDFNTLNTTLLALMNKTIPGGRIWDHNKIDFLQMQADEAYKDDSGLINAWIFRRVRIQDILDSQASQDGFDEVIATNHFWAFEYWRELGDTADARRTSERAFQTQIDTVRAAFAADNTLGLGPVVSHGGLQTLQDIGKPKAVADGIAHYAIFLLRVWTGDC
jgi:hypothetical protein